MPSPSPISAPPPPWLWWQESAALPVALPPVAPRLAVVIPCHDVDPYLGDALGSLEAQPVFRDTQVICVDDGSSDKTPLLLEDFAARHANVTLLRLPGRGPGAARNAGLARVEAPYVTFLDADDVLADGALDALLDTAEETGADLVIGDHVSFPERPYGPWKHHFGSGDKVFTHPEDVEDLVFSCAAWGRLFRTGLLSEAGLRFAEGMLFEDAWLTVPALLRAGRTALLDRTVVYYRRREDRGSIMDALWRRDTDYWDHLRLNQRLLDIGRLHDRGRQRLVQRFAARTYQGFITRAHRMLRGEELERLFASVREMYAMLPEQITDEYATRADQRLALYAVRTGDLALFASPDPATARRPTLHIDDEGLFLTEADDEGTCSRLRVGPPVAGPPNRLKPGPGLQGWLSIPGAESAELTTESLENRLELAATTRRGVTTVPAQVEVAAPGTLTWRIASTIPRRARLTLHLHDQDRPLQIPLPRP